ncbi:MAG: branched-chain amino acid ABC transporter permease [Alphaproteobacteria bacterium]|nr:branched-chain amino acid ABC transporter permease [Alphaproteobacteria bacterium]
MSLTLVQVIVSGLLVGAVYALFSSGLSLVWGMMNVINFAHGDFVMLGMYTAFVAMVWLHGGPLLFGPAAAVLLFLLGVIVYYGLVRQVMRGPMLAQILSTFGLALVIRYAAFWVFSANFVTLPEGALGGTVNLAGIFLGLPQLISGVVALVLTAGMYLLLSHTAIGSRLLAVAEDRNAAMLMGIRPDRMQALAWGLASAAAGIAGALMAAIYPISPTIGETLAITAFVVVTFGGFGSVPGALVAGLVIGVVQGLSAFWFGPIYRDVAVYVLFVLMLWVRPQGLMGRP